MIVLKRFAQEADMSNPDKIEYFLVFDRDGHELRLPVPKETVDSLIQEVYGNRVEKSAEVEEEEEVADHPPGATEFGGDVESDEFFDHTEFHQEEEEQPTSEDEVPSL